PVDCGPEVERRPKASRRASGRAFDGDHRSRAAAASADRALAGHEPSGPRRMEAHAAPATPVALAGNLGLPQSGITRAPPGESRAGDGQVRRETRRPATMKPGIPHISGDTGFALRDGARPSLDNPGSWLRWLRCIHAYGILGQYFPQRPLHAFY